MIRLYAFLLVASLAGLSSAQGRGVLLDEVVAVVEGRALTAGMVEVEARLRLLKVHGPVALERPVDGRALGAALDAMVDDLVVLTEAERLQVFGVAEDEVQQAVEGLEMKVGGAALERLRDLHELSEGELAGIVRRALRVSRYLEGRFLLASRPREADVRSHLAAEPAMYQPLSPEAAAEAAREHMTRLRFEARCREFTADARRRARVRILRDFSGEARTPATGTVSASDEGRRREAAPRPGGT